MAQITFHPTITAYIEASNADDFDSLIALFTPDAVVIDEGLTHSGVAEIRRWIEKSHKDYTFTVQARDATNVGEDTIVTCLVAGDFPGSPVDLRFSFTIQGGKIAALTIRE